MSGFVRHERHIVNADTDYFSCLDEHRDGDRQMLILHCYFLKVTPRVFRRVLSEWRTLRHVIDAPIYCAGDDDDDKWHRFVTLFGFRYLMSIPCTDGRTRRLFISTKDIDDGRSRHRENEHQQD